jgi:hypothetical protein
VRKEDIAGCLVLPLAQTKKKTVLERYSNTRFVVDVNINFDMRPGE